MRDRLIAVAALLGCLPASATGQNFLLSDDSTALIGTYLTCVVGEATKLEAAGESVSDTVDLGKTACSNHELPINLAIVRDINTKLPKVAPSSAANIIQKLRVSVYEQVTAEARLRLAKARSEKRGASH